MNRERKYNYNSVNKFVAILCLLNVLNLFFFGIQNYMFYKVNQSVLNFTLEEKIDINSCSFEALTSLSGIGEKKALDIIEGRPYQDIYEIHRYVGDKVFYCIKDKITIKED